MRNIEWKGRLLDPLGAEQLCRELGACFVAELEQRDTYYDVPSGRLKRRDCAGRPTEWIEYFRPDETKVRASDYRLLDPGEAARLHPPGSLAERVVVEKRRRLYLHGEVRIHRDRVTGLGDCFELEALVNERQDEAAARHALDALLAEFKPVLGAALAGSYSDLLIERR